MGKQPPRYLSGTAVAPYPSATARVTESDRRIAANLRRLRLERGIPLDAVAALLGVSYQQVQKYESGTNRICLSRLALLRDFYDVAMDDFLDGLSGTRRRAPAATEDAELLNLCQKLARLTDPDLRLRAGRIIDTLLTHG
jgi:transcriptional regulator with XRE-family HTH domain